MTIPYLAVAYLLGPEFPSMLGGLVGLCIVVPAAKAGWFMPAEDQDLGLRRTGELGSGVDRDAPKFDEIRRELAREHAGSFGRLGCRTLLRRRCCWCSRD